MESAKLAALSLFKIKVFSNEGYGVIISFHGVTNEFYCKCGHMTKVW